MSTSTAPACQRPALGGCIGDVACDYCGQPMPAEHVVRSLLDELARHLRRLARR